MTGVGGPNGPAPSGRPARRRAVGMTAVTRRADGEGTAALTAGSLSEGLVHGVGARGAISDWTTDLNRGTTAATGSVCRSSGRSRGSGWGTTGPSPALYATRTQRWRPTPGPWTPTLPMDAKSAPTGSLENREERGFPQRPQPASSSPSISRKRSDAGLERTDGCREYVTFRRPLTPWLVRFPSIRPSRSRRGRPAIPSTGPSLASWGALASQTPLIKM